MLSGLDVDMCNLHAAGTIEMMKAALAGLTREDGTRPLLIAVTQLTSTSEERMQKGAAYRRAHWGDGSAVCEKCAGGWAGWRSLFAPGSCDGKRGLREGVSR